MKFEEHVQDLVRQEFEKWMQKWEGERIATEKVPEKFMSRKEAASYLGCSVATIDNMVRYRRLEKYKMGRSTKFKKCDLDNLPR